MTTRLNPHQNQVYLTGNLCKPPRLTTSTSGKPILTLVLAVQRPAHMPIKRRSDASVEPDYPPVVIDGEIAAVLARFLKTGDSVTVEGIFQTRNYIERLPGLTRRRTAMEVLCAAITLPRPDTELNLGTLEHVQAVDEATVTVDLAPVTPTDPAAEPTQADPTNANSLMAQAPVPRPKRKKSHRKKKSMPAITAPMPTEPGTTMIPIPAEEVPLG